MPAMESLMIALLVLVLLGLALVAYLLLAGAGKKENTESLMLLQNQIQDLSRVMESKLGEGTVRMVEGIRSQAEAAQRMTEHLSKQLMEVARIGAETKESTKQVFTIAESLQNLEKVLKHQKNYKRLLTILVVGLGTFKVAIIWHIPMQCRSKSLAIQIWIRAQECIKY
jgi:uncharacterized protein HemX